MNTPESKADAYAEEKAEQWLLSPEGGWKYKPDEKDFILRTEPFVQEVLPVFKAEKAAYLAGYTADRWIPVSPETMPPLLKKVLGISSKGQIVFTCMDMSGNMDQYELTAFENDYFTHWQPLPSPPTK